MKPFAQVLNGPRATLKTWASRILQLQIPWNFFLNLLTLENRCQSHWDNSGLVASLNAIETQDSDLYNSQPSLEQTNIGRCILNSWPFLQLHLPLNYRTQERKNGGHSIHFYRSVITLNLPTVNFHFWVHKSPTSFSTDFLGQHPFALRVHGNLLSG
jgi:hypothetical protein